MTPFFDKDAIEKHLADAADFVRRFPDMSNNKSYMLAELVADLRAALYERERILLIADSTQDALAMVMNEHTVTVEFYEDDLTPHQKEINKQVILNRMKEREQG